MERVIAGGYVNVSVDRAGVRHPGLQQFSSCLIAGPRYYPRAREVEFVAFLQGVLGASIRKQGVLNIGSIFQVAPDMFTASRHAQTIAENFLADVDDFQRASRDADRRAMSHFDAAASPEVGLKNVYPRTRRSVSVMRYSVPTTSDYGRVRYWSSSVDPVRYTTYSHHTPSVTVVGSRYPRSQDYLSHYGFLPTKKVYDRAYPYSYYYPGSYYSYPSSYYYYDDYVPTSRYYYNYYPRSYLSQPPNHYNYYNSRYYPYYGYNDILPTSHLRASNGPKPNWEFLSRPTLTRRWWSSSDLLSDVNNSMVAPTPRVHRTRRGQHRAPRYSSVPPAGLSLPTYQRATSVAPAPRHFYAHYYSDLTEETPSYYSLYTSPNSRTATRAAYRNFYRPTALGAYPSSLNAISSEVMAERRRIDRKMDNLLDYKLPPADYFTAFRSSLRSSLDPEPTDDKDLSLHILIGYGPLFVAPSGSPTSELRGRIKRLLCRSHKDPHHFRYFPQAVVAVGAT
ncbi:hypothetical protein SprV_0401591200 [Sparganum proliferum]